MFHSMNLYCQHAFTISAVVSNPLLEKPSNLESTKSWKACFTVSLELNVIRISRSESQSGQDQVNIVDDEEPTPVFSLMSFLTICVLALPCNTIGMNMLNNLSCFCKIMRYVDQLITAYFGPH